MAIASLPSIFPARAVDLPAVLDLLRQCELPETGVAESIAGFHVAQTSGVLVGCAGLELYGKAGLLRSVAVLPSTRALGLGTSLVSRAAAAARDRGLEHLYLLTTTATAFFARRGFSIIERSSAPAEVAGSWEFKVGCPQAAVAMRLALSAG